MTVTSRMRDGNLIEADLEEVYFYKIDRPEGYAYQRVYTDASSPLHQQGNPIDAHWYELKTIRQFSFPKATIQSSARPAIRLTI